MPSYNVYISSTFRDLESYRKKVRESLTKFTNFQVVGMEDYVAENLQPLDRCLRDVADCDIYLLILANRYGYVPEQQDKSITHLEYLKAVELKKIILVFKADNHDGRFVCDVDETGQPSSAQKQAKLNALKADVGRNSLSHPEGFTSEYHLALQVMESLARNPAVAFDGGLPEERKIFCDRTNQVYDFYDLVHRKKSFNVFLIQGNRNNLGRSLVERLSTYFLGISELTMVSYHDLVRDPSYPNFRRRLLGELCDQLLPNALNLPSEPVDLLRVMQGNGSKSLSFLSLVSDALQWQNGYQFLTKVFDEFDQASQQVEGIRIFWFIVIDVPDALQQQAQAQSLNSVIASPLNMVSGIDIETWLRMYIDSDDEIVYSLQELCFPDTLNPCELNMVQAQRQIKDFINRFNLRRKNKDNELMKILSEQVL